MSNLIDYTPQKDFLGYLSWEGPELIGAVFFSRLDFAQRANAYLLSPLAVASSQQNRGVAKALVQQAIADLKKAGVEFLMTYGDIHYYSKYGFTSQHTIPTPFEISFPEAWLALALNEGLPQINQAPRCVEVFHNPAYW